MLPLILGITLAAIGVGTLVYVALQGRDSSGTGTSENAKPDQATMPAGLVAEMRALTGRIEQIFEVQQVQGETQRQRLAQEIDSVRDHIEEQQHLIAGLRNELRNEIRRRDDELKALRHRLEATGTERAFLDAPADPEPGGDSVHPTMGSVVLSPASQNGNSADKRGENGPSDDQLTTINSIDEETGRRLHEIGVRSLDEIAHWGREDARRIAEEIDVPEETILNEWIFAAQAALFERHQALFSED